MKTIASLAVTAMLAVSLVAVTPYRHAHGSLVPTHPAAACNVRGAWQLESETVNGKDEPLNGALQRKIVTAHRFMWLEQAGRRDTLPMNTATDTLRAYRVVGGEGTYTLRGNSYVEHIEMFVAQSYVGTDWRATCRTDGRRWYHSYTDPNDTTKATGPITRVVEVWRRIE
ncbi:MAG TPA: hypothetical protein VJ867_00260 [Gemmatimonadaceae bacterium]|nr:hypothetical protein [Gemmatimonadaceae bacterium]